MNFSDLHCSPEWGRCSMMDLIPFILDVDTKTGKIEITPSRFMKEMLLSTEQRLEKLNKTAIKRVLAAELGLKAFKPKPDIVIFQNFRPGSIYTVSLSLLNTTDVAKPLKIEMEPSAFFTFKYATDDVYSKVAPGMSRQVEINFSAVDLKDYNHRIVFLTEGENIEVKLLAIGPRPLLDLPDKINVPTTVFKVQTERTILVRNLGQVRASFIVKTDAPFFVSPNRDLLDPNENLKLKILFKPEKLGLNQGSLTVVYETGERLTVKLEGVCEEANVRLNCNKVVFEDTYLGLTAKVDVVLENLSAYMLEYKWKRYQDGIEEAERKDVLKSRFEVVKDHEEKKNNRLIYYEIATGGTNNYIYEKILQDEINECNDNEDDFLFIDSEIRIEPMTGEVWRESKVTFSVFFAPKAAGFYEKYAYLQVAGLARRERITLFGRCLGPNVSLNVEELDAQNIYIRAAHTYEVGIVNFSPIPATIVYKPTKTTFGGTFSCVPPTVLLKANERNAFWMEFVSENRGKFVEEVEFIVTESGDVLKFVLIGNIVCPLLNFDAMELNFGNVPLGNPITMNVNLLNSSQVAVEYEARITEDGFGPCYTLEAYSKMSVKHALHHSPKEFHCEPNGGVVEAYSCAPLALTLVANTAGTFLGNLTLFMWGSRQNNRSIPVRYSSHCPQIICMTHYINLKSVFITQTNYRSIRLVNKSQYPGFIMISTFQASISCMELNTDITEAIMEPNASLEVIITAKADMIGDFMGGIAVFGLKEAKKICDVVMSTRGPCITLSTERLNLGKIPTLVEHESKVILSNDSPIPAILVITTTGSFVTLLETEIRLEPESTATMHAVIYGTCRGKFKSTIKVAVECGDVETVTVLGECVGSSIRAEPALSPSYYFGTIFTQHPCEKSVSLTNQGNVVHDMVVSQNKNGKRKLKDDTSIALFKIVPDCFELAPNQTSEIRIIGFSEVAYEAEELFYLHAKINRSSNLVLISTFCITASFKDPTVSFSKRSMEFRMDVGNQEDVLSVLENKITLTNNTEMEVGIGVTIDKPFYMMSEGEKLAITSEILKPADEVSYSVIFEPPQRDSRCFMVHGDMIINYSNHPKEDKITLSGTVNYPTIRFVPESVNFTCVEANQTQYIQIMMMNISPLKVEYSFAWREDTFEMSDFTFAPKVYPEVENITSSELLGVGTTGDATVCRLSDESSAPTDATLVTEMVEQLPEESEPQISSDKLEEEMRREEDYLSVQAILAPLVVNYTTPIDEEEVKLCKVLDRPQDMQMCIYKAMDLVPAKGVLQPLECQLVSVAVTPYSHCRIECDAICHVVGGEDEILHVRAISEEMCYHLESTIVDFGVVQINHICTQQFTLENTGFKPFNYFLTYEDKWHGIFQAVPHWLNIFPTTGTLNTGEECVFEINYFPGFIGLFTEKFDLEIGYNDSISLTLQGNAVFRQVFYDFPRPTLENHYYNELSYYAISDLVYPQHAGCTGFMHSREEVAKVAAQGFVLVNYKQKYPSPMDIQMALERRIALRQMLCNSKIVPQFYKIPTSVIPSISLPPYVINFGYVVADTIVDIPLKPTNYNDTNIKIAWPSLGRINNEKGFTLVNNKGNGPHLVFSATSKVYKKYDQHVDMTCQGLVHEGVTLSFQVKAIVTIPMIRLCHHRDSIEFGKVMCGNCLMKSIAMENCGNVTTYWTVSVAKSRHNTYFTYDKEGFLNPGEFFMLNIYYEPNGPGRDEAVLKIEVQQNKDGNDIVLKGYGIEPSLRIEPQNIIFEPAIPYSINNTESFTITNNSALPICFFFSEFDTDIEFEDHVVRAILMYNNAKKLYVPPRGFGDCLSSDLIDAYRKIRLRLSNLLLERLKRTFERVNNTPTNSVSEVNTSQSHIEEGRTNLSNSMFQTMDPHDPLAEKTYDEILKLLRDNQVVLKEQDEDKTRVMKSIITIAVTEPDRQSVDLGHFREGVLLIFHGAPNTANLQAANRTGLALNLPVYSIDQLMYHSLICNQSLAAMKVNEEIDVKFENIASEVDLLDDPYSDEFDDLDKKVKLILSGKEKSVVKKEKKEAPGSGKKSGNESSKKASSNQGSSATSKTSKKKKGNEETFMGLQLELFYQILQQQLLKFRRGLVIESLNSIFIKVPYLVLMGVLEAVGHIRYIQCVYFSLTFEEYVMRKQQMLEQENILTERKKKRIAEISDMTAEEFAALSHEDMVMFKKFYLLPRKKASEEKREALKEKLLQKKDGKKIAVVGSGKKQKSADLKLKEGKKIKSSTSKKSEKRDSSTKGSRHSDHDDLGEELVYMLKAAEMDAMQILHIANSWDRKNRALLSPIPMKLAKEKQKNANKAAKSPKKKETKVESKMGSKKGTRKDSESSRLDEEGEGTPTDLPKIDVRFLTPEEVVLREQIGLHCWIVKGANSESGVSMDEIVVAQLVEFGELHVAILDLIESLKEHPDEREKMYTVLRDPSHNALRNTSENFKMYDAIETKHIDEDSLGSNKGRRVSLASNSLSTITNTTANTKKRSRPSSRKNSLKSSMTSSAYRKLTPRNILMPGEALKFDVHFLPMSSGDFVHVCNLQQVLWRKHMSVHLEAKAAIPKIYIDPGMLFGSIRKEKSSTGDFTMGYLKDGAVFSFGSVTKQDPHNYNHCLDVEAKFNIISASYIPSLVSFDFFEPTQSFHLSHKDLTVFPNNSDFITACSHPPTIGLHKAKLLITIKNNPEVYQVDVQCLGGAIDVDIIPRELVFERMLLNCPIMKTLLIKNKGVIALQYAVDKEKSRALDVFQAFKTCGKIPAHTEKKMVFEYTAKNLEDVPKMNLVINFFDSEMKCTEPLRTENVQISAEVIEISVESLKMVSVGEVKVDALHVIPYKMINHSKYDLKYRFEIFNERSKEASSELIRSYFKMEPPEGVLKPNYPAETKICFRPTSPDSFRDIPIFTCRLTDQYLDKEVATFEVSISGKVYSSTFELCPSTEINFGHQMIKTEAFREVVLRNKGRHSFDYAVFSMAKKKGGGKKKEKNGKGGGKKSKKESNTKGSSSKSTKSTKESSKSKKEPAKKKVKETKLKEGIFTLVSSTGTIEAGDEAVIKISAKPIKPGDFDAKVVVFVTEASGRDRKGRKIIITAKGSLPTLDFDDTDEIFNELKVVETMNSFNCPEQMGNQPVYVKSENLLCFSKCCLNLESKSRIKIQNGGMISADAYAKITQGEGIFSVRPFNVQIEAYKHEYLEITFKPNAIDQFYGMLEVGCDMGTELLHVKLFGNGFIPEIAMIQPMRDPITSTYSINFNPLMIGSTATEMITFRNVGTIPCKVLAGVLNDDFNMVRMVPRNFPKILERLCTEEYLRQEFSHTYMVELKPDEDCTLDLNFEPRKEIAFTSYVRLYTINNPFEIIEIVVSAQSYKADVIIEGLQTVALNNTDEITKHGYELNYGHCFINKLHKICFKIRNTSQEDIFKFIFNTVDKVMFIPSVGHLKPDACKDVIATCFSPKPIQLDKYPVECRLCKIKYICSEHEPLSWDERQHFTIWQIISSDGGSKQKVESETKPTEEMEVRDTQPQNRLKVIKEREEPPIEEIGDADRIMFYLSINSDYCSYWCDIDCIRFEDTYIFEKRTATFKVTNTSSLPLNLDWNLTTDEGYPVRIPSSKRTKNSQPASLQPSSVRPRTCTNRPVNLTGSEQFIEHSTRSSRPKSMSTLFSCTLDAGSSTRSSNDTWSETGFMPFDIQPVVCSIAPGDTLEFTVSFTPLEVYEYLVYAKTAIPNLNLTDKPLEISIRSKSLLPLYHFNIQTSDYLSKRRNGRMLCGEIIDDSTKVVEFESLGVGIPVTTKFTIVNPTGEDFRYRWLKSKIGPDVSLFKCESPEGHVTRGKMAEASFVFISEKRGVFETVYTFCIEDYGITNKFLLVGTVKEPCVFFDKHSITQKPTIVGIDMFSEFTLINKERVQLEFRICKSSMYSEGRLQKIRLTPRSGFIPPMDSVPFKATFHPSIVGPVIFHIDCKVEHVEKPLRLVINASCLEVQSSVIRITDFGNTEMEPIIDNNIDLSSLFLMKQESVKFVISNLGNIGFYYKWQVPDNHCGDFVKIDFITVEGYAKLYASTESIITIKPIKHLMKKIIKVILNIPYGPTYNVNLICSTCKSKVKLSFKEYDFGACLVQKEKNKYYEAILEISNNDTSPILIETPPEDDYSFLTVVNKANTIAPKKAGKVHIYFHPLVMGRVAMEVPLHISGVVTKVSITGEAVPLEVEVVDPTDKFFNLGALKVLKIARKRVQVVNHSRCSVSIMFDLKHRLPYSTRVLKLEEGQFEKLQVAPSDILKLDKSKKKGKKENKEKEKKKKGGKDSKTDKSSKDKKSKKSSDKSEGKSSKSSKDSKKQGKESSKKSKEKTPVPIPERVETAEEILRRQIDASIRFQPKKWIKLMPDQTTEYTLIYMPTERMQHFTEQVFYQVQENVEPISAFKGSCIAADYYLDRESISFGTVVQGRTNEYKVKLFNTGDIGGRYKWNLGKRQNIFSVTPSEGYITPNMSVTFLCQFIPTHVYCLFRVVAQCNIENFGPLSLELVGSCVNLPKPKEVLNFSCPVRTEQLKQVTIANPTAIRWEITPSIGGDHFKTDAQIVVESRTSKKLDVVFAPTVMSLPNKKHETKLFLPLPDGQGIMYDLIGEAQRPKAQEKLERSIPSKTYHSEVLDVYNWLPVAQQFTVLNQTAQPPKQKVKVMYKLTGNSIIDVPAYGERMYKWTIFALNEGTVNFKVKFRNMATGEYILYEIDLTIQKSEPLEEITMNTCARKSTYHKIRLENPIKEPTVFNVVSTCPDLYFDKVVNCAPYSEVELVIEYLPIFTSTDTITVKLEAKSTTLGIFPYTLQLTAEPAVPEPAVHIDSQLGLMGKKTIYLDNFTKIKANFMATFDDAEFSIDKSVSISPSEKGAIDVLFEPSNLGGLQSKLTLTSPVLGEYIYPLIGNGTAPKPRGPYVVKNTAVSYVPFKNPFRESKMFMYSTEPSQVFSVKVGEELLKAKASTKIAVGRNPDGGGVNSEYHYTGKLNVKCEDDQFSEIKWVIYLQSEQH